MKKKILFMLCTWKEAYSQVILKGIERAIENIDIEIHAINVYGSEVEYLTKEVECFLLADVKKYDGVMMLFNGVGTVEYLEKYANECRKYNIPAVSIDISVPGISFCGIDNYVSMYNITEHIIKEHNVTRLHYIGGPEGHPDSMERGKAFLDCLKDNNLEPYGYSYYGFMRSTGRQAYQDIKESGRPMAEAYVFANDFCALGFCLAAKEDGLEPPDDFIVTGFDNQPEAQNYITSITTVDRNLEGLGYYSLIHLLDIIDGKAPADSQKCIPGIVIKGGSCGCVKYVDPEDRYLKLINLLMERNENDSLQKSARDRLCGNDNFEQFQQELRKCMEKRGIADYRICVNRDDLSHDCARTEGYGDVFDVYGANTYVQINREDGLIPDDFKDDTTQIYWFGTLHCKEKTFGYSIFKYTPTLLNNQFHRTLNETNSLAVENIRQSIILGEVNQKLERLYIMDSLTGLYNRFGYNTFSGNLYKENKGKVYIVFIDMDGLKTINDNYGHDYGDIALKGIAEAIKDVFTDTEIKVRMGGDEFLVMGPYISEEELIRKEEKLSDYLLKYTEKMKLPVKLEVSMGHSFNSGNDSSIMDYTGLETLLKYADVKMYNQKKSKKNRKR